MHDKDAYNIFGDYRRQKFKENKIRFWVCVVSKDRCSDVKEYVDTNIVPRLRNMGCHLEYESIITSYGLHYFHLDISFPI